jgi:DNA-binding response OmpR family regulator
MPSKILVVDDDTSVRYFTDKVLTREGYVVAAVDSGETAITRIGVEHFDLALIDLKLSGIGGMQVLAYLREHSPETVAIVITAHASLETAVEALRCGAHDYLFKPCPTIELRQSVRAALEKYRPPSESASVSARATEQGRFMQLSGLIVDPVRHIITLDGKLLELSPTEFNLLAYLVAEAPRVVSAQELVREVQGYESNAHEARETVRSHLHHIRIKIRQVSKHNVLKTVRGVGYTLESSSFPVSA